MPTTAQRPSRRTSGESLDRLIQEANRGLRVHALMAIESERHLRRYIDVMYFRPARDPGARVDVVGDRTGPPAGLETYESGFTLATIEQAYRAWPDADQQAFKAFIWSSDCRKFLSALHDNVVRVRAHILEHGEFLARLQALWWQEGIHPVQTEED